MGQGKTGYGDVGKFYAVLVAPKLEFCVTISEYGIIDGKRIFQGFGYVTKLLRR